MQDHRLVVGQALVGGRRGQVGLELERAARDVQRARGLAGLCELGAVAQVDQHGAVGDHVDRVLAGDFRHGGVGFVDELFGGGRHARTPGLLRVNLTGWVERSEPHCDISSFKKRWVSPHSALALMSPDPSYQDETEETAMSELRYPNETRAYRDAREALLKDEQELIDRKKALAEKRRKLPPGGQLKEDYVFQRASDGKVGQRVKF